MSDADRDRSTGIPNTHRRRNDSRHNYRNSNKPNLGSKDSINGILLPSPSVILYSYAGGQTQSINTPFHYHSALDCVVRIIKEEGPRTFYSGLVPSLIGVSHVVVQFPALEYLKHVLTPPDWPPPDHTPHSSDMSEHHAKPLSLPMHRLIVAIIISKALASGATYPHEVLRTRLQNQHGGISNPNAKYKGLLHAFRMVIQEEGARGLYGGFGVNLIRTVPSSIVTLLGFEVVRSWLGA
jgi:solute carrier family 25 (mitochondrial folate transporter), member 32